MRGGYKIIDLAGAAFEWDNEDKEWNTVTVEGVYDAIEASYGKPLLIHNYSIEGVEQPDRWVNMVVNVDASGETPVTTYEGMLHMDSNGNFTIISVNDDDGVTLVPVIIPEPEDPEES